MEVKVAEGIDRMEEAAAKAARQIREKEYVHELRTEGYRRITGYGVAFYRKDCEVCLMEEEEIFHSIVE